VRRQAKLSDNRQGGEVKVKQKNQQPTKEASQAAIAGLISMNMKQASQATGLSVRTLYDRIASGDLESVMRGRRRLILSESLRKFIEGT
jgi:excisionase family DNA binding protein